MQGVTLKEALTIVMEDPQVELDIYEDFDDTVPDLAEVIGQTEG